MSLSYYGMLAAGWIIGRVPRRLSLGVARGAGVLYYYIFPRKRQLARKNMRRALGPGTPERLVRQTARRVCRYYAEYWVDILWLPTRTRQYVLDRFRKIDEEPLEKAAAAGGGVIVVLPHFGSWEAGAVYLSSLGPFAAVAEVLKPKELFDLFIKLRAGVGIRIFPYDHSPETRDAMVGSLRDGTILALLCDRDLKGGGVEVEFFGERTTLPPGPASLALKSGSPIVCVNVRNVEDGTWIGHATDPIYVTSQESALEKERAIQETMQKVARRLEMLIREDPAQWHMLMPAWPSDRE